MSKILVTGATGTSGSALVQELIQRNADFVIASRNPETAKAKFHKEAIRKFAFDDPSTFESAIEGVGKVFLLGPPLQYDVDQLINPFIDFLKKKGIKRVVYFSALANEKMKSINFHSKIEAKLKADGFDYTILKPTFFAQNFKNYQGENILDRNMIFLPAGPHKVGFLDVNDIAAVAAVTLTENGHQQKTYELTGPELLSHAEVAYLLSETLNRKIVYSNPSEAEFKEVLKESGAPDFIADYLIDVYQVIAKNNVAVLTDTIKRLTGKNPTTLKEVLIRDFTS